MLCNRCKQEKDIAEFNTSNGKHKSYCKQCSLEYRRNWINRNKHKYKEYNVKYSEGIKRNSIIRNKKSRDNLEDYYIIKRLRQAEKFTIEDIKKYPELIEIKRIIIKIKRFKNG